MKKALIVLIICFSLLGCSKDISNDEEKEIYDVVGGTSDTIMVEKSDLLDSNKFNKYLERDEKTIYLASNIKEVYYSDAKNKMLLNEYISKSWQTMDDGIDHLIRYLELYGELNDGGTKIYKSQEFDITLVKCNKINGNKNIFIGDYNMQYDDNTMCKD